MRIFKGKEHAEVEFTVAYLPCFLIAEQLIVHFYYIAQSSGEFASQIYLCICRLGLYQWMMTLGKKLLPNLQLQ